MAAKTRVQFKFMIPLDLKKLLEDAALQNNRSLSGELVARLAQTFAVGKRLSDLESDTNASDEHIGTLYNLVEELASRLRALENPVDE